MKGERNMIRTGYRWDVIADFKCNNAGVRVGVFKTKRGAAREVHRFYRANRRYLECVFTRLRHDPLLDETMNKRSKRR